MVDDPNYRPRAAVVLDAQTRRSADGSALLGGHPFRVLKLSPDAVAHLDEWLSEGAGPIRPVAEGLYARLVDAGLIHPTPAPASDLGSAGAVVPVLDDLEGLQALLPSLRDALGPNRPIVVVDDGSVDAARVEAVARPHAATVLHHPHNRGPAAARNTGFRWLRERHADATLVLFSDADVVVDRAALALLIGHLQSDRDLDIVAPRVCSVDDPGPLSAYEHDNSPLDLGDRPARVQPQTRVPYVPSALVVARPEALEALGGFDESMRLGEDVDLIWRAVRNGYSVRYEPRAVARHRNRPGLLAMAKQRFSYGKSAAALDRRHVGHVFPVELSVTHLLVWTALTRGTWVWRMLGVYGLGASIVGLKRKLETTIDDSGRVAARLVLDSHRSGLLWLADAMTRAWAPLLLTTRRTRTWYLVALTVPSVIDYVRQRPPIDPLRFAVYRIVDHTAYCLGQWTGSLHARSGRVLLPRFRRR